MLFWMVIGFLLGGSISDAGDVVGDRIIFLNGTKVSHHIAQYECESPTNATQLLRVDTKEIHEWIQEHNDVMWVDGNVKFDLTWDDGSPMNGFAAHHLPEEFCVSANDMEGGLTVKDCSIKQAYAYQWKYDDFDVETAPGRAIKYFDIVKTRDEAADYCENNLPLHGNLITVDNAEINDWVVSKAERMWIGLNDKDAEHVFVWDSGVPFDYSNWMSTGPVDYGGSTENCVEANLPDSTSSLTWNDIRCDWTRRFACEIWLDRLERY